MEVKDAIRIPIVAIVGRPNVGKSTLFNRIVGRQQAVVEDVAGVTRDRNYAHVEHFTVPFYLVDTGGFERVSDDEIQKQVSEQVLLAIEEADLIVCVFDGQVGLQSGDEDVANLLRRSSQPVRYVVNKCDGKEQGALMADFFALGVEELSDLSALHGRGISSFIEATLQSLPNFQELLAEKKERAAVEKDAREANDRFQIQIPEYDEEDFAEVRVESMGDTYRASRLARKEQSDFAEVAPDIGFAPVYVPDGSALTIQEYEKEHRILPIAERNFEAEMDLDSQPDEQPETPLQIQLIKVALIGRPNVGKSTMLNTITGERRALTSPIAGTTRDSINVRITRDEQQFEIIDTAGLRKKARVGDRIEHYSALRSLRAITECDVAVVMLDASTGPTEQDAKIVGLAHEAGKGIVLAVNKWDLIEKDHRSVKDFEKHIREVFKFSPYAPIVFVSALSGRRCPRVLETAKEVAYSRAAKVGTYRLNRLLERALKRKTPPVYRGRPVRLYFGTQVENCPPRFVLFFNYPAEVHFSYLRYLKNSIREEFGFHGTDIKLVCRKR